jgi:hypothetical protein
VYSGLFDCVRKTAGISTLSISKWMDGSLICMLDGWMNEWCAAKEGFHGFYKGVFSPLAGQVCFI